MPHDSSLSGYAMSGPRMDRRIWVDDCKPAPSGCAVARTYDDALRMMRRFDYDVLYLDHDLGEPRTGYDLLMQLIEDGRAPHHVQCISWNPVGRRRIELLAAQHSLHPPETKPGGTP